MSAADPILRAVHAAIADLNDLRPADQALSTEPDAALAAELDSLGIVNLLLSVEGSIEQSMGAAISLTDLLEVDPSLSALATVGSFTALVRSRVGA